MQPTLKLSMKTDQTLIPAEIPAQRVIEIVVSAPKAAERSARARLNLALVIDRSGSMSGEKLDYVKQAALHVLDRLEAQDRVALVAFDDQVNLLAPSTPVTPENRTELQRAIRPLRVGGSTNLSDGWLAGCQEVASAVEEGTLNRALLLTDGMANVGITDLEELARHARELSTRGVSTSTFGVGHHFNEHLLEAMSNQGGGNFYFIETPSEIPALFAREFTELAGVTARAVTIRLQLPPQVSAEVLGGWRSECVDGVLEIYLGDMLDERQQELYVRVLTPPGALDHQLSFTAEVTGLDESQQKMQAQAAVVFRYASQSEAAAEPKQADVMQRFASVKLADVATQALKLERTGQKEQANQLLNLELEANREYVDQEEAHRYEHMARRMQHGMDEIDRKRSHYDAYVGKQRRG